MNATDETDDTTQFPPPPPPPPPAPDPGRRLTRSTDDKVLTGLCGGLGRYFGIDPLIFRVAFVVLALAGGTGILLYLVGWLLIPDDHGGTAIGQRVGKERSRKLVLAVLVGAGILLLFNDFSRDRGPNFPVALVLVALGAAVLWSRRDRLNPPSPPVPGSLGSPGPAGPSGSATPPPSAPPAPPAPPTPTAPTHSPASPTSADPFTPLPGSPPAAGWTAATLPLPQSPLPPPQSPPPPPPARPPRPPKPPSVLVPATLSILALLGGTLALLRAPLVVFLATALLVTGVALVVGAWRGRARWLIPIAVVLAASLGVASVVDVPFTGGAGDRTYRPTTVAELRPTYRLAVGQLVLDLRALDLQGRTETVLVTDGIGHLQVLVPRTAEVVAIGHAGAGDVRLLDSHWGGTHVDQRRTWPGQEGGGRIVVRARVGIGQVEVLNAAA